MPSYAEFLYAECRFAECHCAEYCGASERDAEREREAFIILIMFPKMKKNE
jgi:hypothetical protein